MLSGRIINQPADEALQIAALANVDLPVLQSLYVCSNDNSKSTVACLNCVGALLTEA